MMNVDSIPELTKYVVTASLTDENEQKVPVDASVTYKLLNADTCEELIAETPLLVIDSGTETSVTVTIPASENVCTEVGSKSERRAIIIKAEGLTQIKHDYSIIRIGC